MKGKKGMVALGVLLAVFLSGPFAQAAEPIKIGAILSVTGPASFLGAPEAKTLEMLVAKINATGGINGHEDRADHQGFRRQPGEGHLLRQAADRRGEGPGHHRPLDQRRDDEDQEHLPRRARRILLSCAAAEAIVNPVAKYVFKTPQKDSDAARRIFQQMKKMGITKIGVVAEQRRLRQGRQGAAREARAGVRHQDRRSPRSTTSRRPT